MADEPLASVKRLAQRAASARVARDEAIKDAVSAGHSLRAVADAAALSHAAVDKIAKRTASL